MDKPESITWQQLYRQRQNIAARFGKIWEIPVEKRYHKVLSRYGGDNISILEVGAGDRSLNNRMKDYWQNFHYASCDIDQSIEHDFPHIDKVQGKYDLACGFELIEHLTLGEAHHLLMRLHATLKDGGKLALTTPNIYYPPTYLRDATHSTPFCYDELGALIQLSGFRVIAIYRLYHDALLKKFTKRILLYPLFRTMGIDFARQIMVVAEKVRCDGSPKKHGADT